MGEARSLGEAFEPTDDPKELEEKEFETEMEGEPMVGILRAGVGERRAAAEGGSSLRTMLAGFSFHSFWRSRRWAKHTSTYRNVSKLYVNLQVTTEILNC